MRQGPLTNIKILEIAGIGPGQFCGMLLADMGAKIIRIDRVEDAGLGIPMPVEYNLMNRSRKTITVDLKKPQGIELILKMCETSDAIFEGFRPGVMERFGLAPEECQKHNPRLVYGRMTGWGQSGPLAKTAGHDTNYLALSGALHAIGPKDGLPVIPLNLLADYGGGGIYLALGLLAAIVEARESGEGQVVDAAMVDGASSLMTSTYGMYAGGMWRNERGVNIMDGGAPFIRTYATRDGQSVAVCCAENKFFKLMLDGLGVDSINPKDQYNQSTWDTQKAILTKTFASKTRDEWVALFDGSDACVSPVLSMAEAPDDPHNIARDVFVDVNGVRQPAPAPRFSRTPSAISSPPSDPGSETGQVLDDWGLDQCYVAELRQASVFGSDT